jgi:hypothetical protein
MTAVPGRAAYWDCLSGVTSCRPHEVTLEPGLTAAFRYTVTEADTAAAPGSEEVLVLATPRRIRVQRWSARRIGLCAAILGLVARRS